MLINKTKGIHLASHVKILNSVFSKARGLMFCKKIGDEALVFVFAKERRVDLHMFFVFFSIDVVFLNKEKRIIEVKQSFRPFRIYVSKKKVKYVIELPAGVVEKKSMMLGDKLEWEE